MDKIKLALVDDHLLFRRSMSLLINSFEGMQVVIDAAEDNQCLTKLMTTPVDVLLLDIQMPVMDGFQAMKCIRDSDNQQLKHIPILALTANVIQTEINKCYEFGANDYLAKPFKPDFLFSKIQRLERSYL